MPTQHQNWHAHVKHDRAITGCPNVGHTAILIGERFTGICQSMQSESILSLEGNGGVLSIPW